MIRETLKPLTFQRRQPAKELRMVQVLQYQIGGILVLPGALGAGYLAVLEHIHPLSAEYRMVVGDVAGDTV